MDKTCVAYFSKVGNTAIAAKYLAEKISADLIRLDDQTKYKGFIGFIKGGLLASTAKQAALKPEVYKKMAEYKTIILATPIWAGKTTPAINAVFENVDFKGKKVYAVTTQADPNASGAKERKQFYKAEIESKGGEFVDYFPLAGSAPGKPPRSEADLCAQVDKKVKLK